MPTEDGLLPTVGWEGTREGVDDAKYIHTLKAAIQEAKGSGNTEALSAAAEAQAYLDRILDRIDLSPRQDNTEFPIRREAAKFTNAQLDEYRWGVARRILKLQNRLLRQSDSAPYTPRKEE
jgi:hypothetical protein